MKIKKLLLIVCLIVVGIVKSQNNQSQPIEDSIKKPMTLEELTLKVRELEKEKEKIKEKVFPAKKHWSEKLNIGGYVQLRYNGGLLQTNDALTDTQDVSVGGTRDFSVRRARIKFSGDVDKHVYYYIQIEAAANPTGASGINSGNFAQIRDAYVDINIDEKKQHRFRAGISKVPFGFTNLQSSQNRIEFERPLSLNSATPNERDLGLFYMWAPENDRKLFKTLVEEGYRGSGDYGVFAIGVYQGQSLNTSEVSTSNITSNKMASQKHFVARISKPFKIGNQIIEPGVSAYTGWWGLVGDQTAGTLLENSDKQYLDQRISGQFVLYPKPFGIQAEYNFGKGPQFNNTNNTIETKSLQGGYVTASYQHQFKNHMKLSPYIRYQYYDGGRKADSNATAYTLHEIEGGLEFMPWKSIALKAAFTNRDVQASSSDAKTNYDLSGNFMKLQLQLNY